MKLSPSNDLADANAQMNDVEKVYMAIKENDAEHGANIQDLMKLGCKFNYEQTNWTIKSNIYPLFLVKTLELKKILQLLGDEAIIFETVDCETYKCV